MPRRLVWKTERVRVIQLSDTHLAAATGIPASLQSLLAGINANPPDLVVHTGDVVWFDPDDTLDRSFARLALSKLTCRMLAIPGNHDVGFFSPTNTIDSLRDCLRCKDRRNCRRTCGCTSATRASLWYLMNTAADDGRLESPLEPRSGSTKCTRETSTPSMCESVLDSSCDSA